MTKCVKCGKEISDEEFRERYEEITKKYGIVPMMVPICKECRKDKN